MRRILITAALLATGLLGAGALLSPADAVPYAGGSCNYTTVNGTPQTTSVTALPSPVHVGIQAGPGGMHDDADFEVGACVELPHGVAGPGTFHGGAAGVGFTQRDQNNRLCGGSEGVATVATHYTSPAGVYAIADGNNSNTLAQTGGYAGLSNYESGATEGPSSISTGPGSPDCEQQNGSGTNAGGSVGVSATNTSAPIPFVACGNNDSGQNWSTSGRDGCFLDAS